MFARQLGIRGVSFTAQTMRASQNLKYMNKNPQKYWTRKCNKKCHEVPFARVCDAASHVFLLQASLVDFVGNTEVIGIQIEYGV